MAAQLNKVFLIGNLTRDPELRFVTTGQPVLSFSLAVNRTYVSQTGEKKEEASFIRVVIWGKLAQICGQYLKKGSPVCVEGRLQSRSWDAPDGSKRSAVEVIANNVQFLGRSGAPAKEGAAEVAALPPDTGDIGTGDITQSDTALSGDFANESQPPF